MKLKTTLLTVFISTFVAFAQAPPVLFHNNLDNNNTFEGVEDIEVYNNNLYYSVPSAGKIVKVSLLSPNAPITDVLTGLNFPTALTVVGNELYFLETANAAMQPNTGKLKKIDLTAATPTATTLYSTLQYPIELAMNGTTAYVAETYVTGPVTDFEVEHMELSVITGATKTVLYNNYDFIDDLEYNSNNLYILTYSETTDETTVTKLDVTNNTPGTPTLFWTDEEGFYPFNLTIKDTYMYLNADFSGSAIIRVGMLNPTFYQVVSDQFSFNGNSAYANKMVIGSDNYMYVLGDSYDNVNDVDNYVLYTIDLNILGSPEFSLSNRISIYPNPAVDNFSISNYENGKSYSIYAIDGKLVTTGLYNGIVNTQNLSKGLYMVTLENGTSIKLQKQ